MKNVINLSRLPTLLISSRRSRNNHCYLFLAIFFSGVPRNSNFPPYWMQILTQCAIYIQRGNKHAVLNHAILSWEIFVANLCIFECQILRPQNVPVFRNKKYEYHMFFVQVNISLEERLCRIFCRWIWDSFLFGKYQTHGEWKHFGSIWVRFFAHLFSLPITRATNESQFSLPIRVE